MATKSKAETPRQLLKRITTALEPLGYKVSSRERSGGAEKVWVNSDKPLDWYKVLSAVAGIEHVSYVAADSAVSVSRAFRLVNQSNTVESQGSKNQLFIAATRPTKLGKFWADGMDV
jgi:hypothetical protein